MSHWNNEPEATFCSTDKNWKICKDKQHESLFVYNTVLGHFLAFSHNELLCIINITAGLYQKFDTGILYWYILVLNIKWDYATFEKQRPLWP